MLPPGVESTEVLQLAIFPTLRLVTCSTESDTLETKPVYLPGFGVRSIIASSHGARVRPYVYGPNGVL